jgi:hypothetical protein
MLLLSLIRLRLWSWWQWRQSMCRDEWYQLDMYEDCVSLKFLNIEIPEVKDLSIALRWYLPATHRLKIYILKS